MPRFARARKPKEPVAPVVYEVSPEIETVMHRLIRLNPVQFGWVNNFKLGCVIVRGAKAKSEGGCVVLARFVKVPPLWHGLTAYDAVIRVEDWAWRNLAADQQEALVAHELCHGSMSEKGALRVMKHDLEEFGFVVRKYGAWQEHIALFDKQLAMFEPGLGTSAPVEGEQTVIAFKRSPRPVAEIAKDVAALPPDQAAVVIDVVHALATEGVRPISAGPGAEDPIDYGMQPEDVEPEDIAALEAAIAPPALNITPVAWSTGDDDLLPGERLSLGACPFPGCELAAEHPGLHQPPPVDCGVPFCDLADHGHGKDGAK